MSSLSTRCPAFSRCPLVGNYGLSGLGRCFVCYATVDLDPIVLLMPGAGCGARGAGRITGVRLGYQGYRGKWGKGWSFSAFAFPRPLGVSAAADGLALALALEMCAD